MSYHIGEFHTISTSVGRSEAMRPEVPNQNSEINGQFEIDDVRSRRKCSRARGITS